MDSDAAVRRPMVYHSNGAIAYKSYSDTVEALRVVGGELAVLGGLLHCRCGYQITDITPADTAHWLSFGWPTHCGPYAMRWMTAKELAAREAAT
jgi:hypothetical protein